MNVAAADFDALAQEFFGKRLAIVIDGVVFSAPTINAAEFGGQLLISGDFEQADAAEMAAALSVDGSRLQFRPFVDEALQSEMTAEELAARAGG